MFMCDVIHVTPTLSCTKSWHLKVIFLILVTNLAIILPAQRSALFSVIKKDHRLDKNVLKLEKFVTSLIECSQFCLAERCPLCQSINYGKEAKNGKKKCQLNNKTEIIKPESLVYDAAFDYWEPIDVKCTGSACDYECKPTVCCGDPGYPSRGYRSSSLFTFGSTVTFHCHSSNEVLSGETSTTCQANSTWSNRTPNQCGAYNIRLAGNGNGNYEGRVEVHHPSYGWGTVCDDAWDTNDGNVVCRQLGFSGASQAPYGAHFGEGTGDILLDQLSCSGSESYLWDCSRNEWTIHDCSHSEDASVICY